MNKSKLLLKIGQVFKFLRSKQISKTKKFFFILALVYIFVPLDIIPDTIPVVGWLDDLGIAYLALTYVFKQMDKQEKLEQEAKAEQEIVIENDSKL